MTAVEILTLVPLGTLVVVFGIQPGLLLDLVTGTTADTLVVLEPSAPIAVPTEIAVGVIGLLVVLILARIGWALFGPRRVPLEAEGGAAH